MLTYLIAFQAFVIGRCIKQDNSEYMDVMGDMLEDDIEMNNDQPDDPALKPNNDAFYSLDKSVRAINKKMINSKYRFKYQQTINKYLLETEPNRYNDYNMNNWIVGFRRKEKQFEQRGAQLKREANVNTRDLPDTKSITSYYNYDSLKAEYDAEINNMTGDMVDKVEEKSMKNSSKEAVEIKLLICSNKDRMGIWIKALKCTFADYRDHKITLVEYSQNLKRIAKFWLVVYIAIAIPCWCKYGWCFCCCRCRFCKPRRVIDDAKRYLMQNPPGLLKQGNEQALTFPPMEMEKYAFNNLDYALRNI